MILSLKSLKFDKMPLYLRVLRVCARSIREGATLAMTTVLLFLKLSNSKASLRRRLSLDCL